MICYYMNCENLDRWFFFADCGNSLDYVMILCTSLLGHWYIVLNVYIAILYLTGVRICKRKGCPLPEARSSIQEIFGRIVTVTYLQF